MNPFLAKIYVSLIKKKEKRDIIFDILVNKNHSKHLLTEKELLKKLNETVELQQNTFNLLKLTIDPIKLPKATGFLRLQQKASLGILKRFTQFLMENKIDYWLDFGTLLGAVRHSGFIPWDDDIDIAMTRPNYEKLKQILHLFCKNGFSYSEGDIIRIFYKDTTAQIDIFPYDFGNSNELPTNENYSNLTKKLQELYQNIPFDFSNYRKSIIPNNYKIKISEIYKNEILQNQKIPDNAFLFLAFHCFAWKRVLCSYNEIFPLRKIKFEDFEFSCPNDIFTHLSNYFGDFMSLPNKCYSHHNFTKHLSVEQINDMKFLIGE